MKKDTRSLHSLNPFSPWGTPPLRVDGFVGAEKIEAFNGACTRKDSSKRNLSEEARELINIRKSLGMIQADFALAIGLEKDKIVNMENGRIRNIPPQVLDEARKIFNGEYDDRVKPLEKLQNLSMPMILDHWWSMMGVDDDSEGAILLGICALTVERWRKSPSRPSARDLLRYDLIARKIADKRNKSIENISD